MSDSNSFKDKADPIENYDHIEKKKFGIPCAEDEHTLTLIMGPTRGGKSYQMKKLLLDVWVDVPKGQAPFDTIYYVGQEKSFQEMRTAFASMEFVYTGRKDNFKTEVKLYTCTQANQCLMDIQADDRDKKKFAIFDDCYSINSTPVLRKAVVNLAQQGQHHSLTSWVVVHQATEKDGVSLRRPANYLVFCNEAPQTVGLLTQQGPDTPPMKAYELSYKANDGHRVLLYDQSNQLFYDYKYQKL
jgi:hypothetical protein